MLTGTNSDSENAWTSITSSNYDGYMAELPKLTISNDNANGTYYSIVPANSNSYPNNDNTITNLTSDFTAAYNVSQFTVVITGNYKRKVEDK